MSKPCLHCTINAAIELYFEITGNLHGEGVVLDTCTILDALVKVMVELLVVEPDEEIRRQVCIQFIAKILRRTKELQAAGVKGDPIFRPS
jgi:hypothetical protein